MKKFLYCVAAAIIVSAVSACGIKGDLYMPHAAHLNTQSTSK